MSAQANSSAAELEDMEDKLDAAHALLAYLDTARSEFFPSALVDRLMDGEPPVLVYREYRELTAAELAERAAVDPEALRNWERGDAEPGLSAAARLARALEIDVDLLVPWRQD